MELRNNKQHKITEGPKCISELRQDLVGGDWMIVATGRAKRPNSFTGGRQKFEQNISQCPFEDPQATGHGEPLLIYYQGGQKWSLQVIKNKFPALGQGDCSKTYKEGPYTLMDGTGFHEIIITRDHKKHLALMSIEKVEEVLGAYQERYLMLMDHKCVNYIFVFHNHGKEAGATIPHPHTLPPGLSLTHTPFPLGLSLTHLPTHPGISDTGRRAHTLRRAAFHPPAPTRGIRRARARARVRARVRIRVRVRVRVCPPQPR